MRKLIMLILCGAFFVSCKSNYQGVGDTKQAAKAKREQQIRMIGYPR